MNMKIYPITFTSNQNNKRKGGGFASRPFIENRSMQEFYPIKNGAELLPWVKDENLILAIDKLNHLKFDECDVRHVQSMGIVIPFLSGGQAVKFIADNHVGVKFDRMPNINTHAQYDFDENCIKINEIYQYTKDPAEIIAIAEAILHEAGHAKDKDGGSTIQEELGCLSLNALSHRVFSNHFGEIFEKADALIIKDGVCVYADLFFDADPKKSKLKERMKRKYGELPAGDFKHPPSNIAFEIKGF